MCAVCGCSAAAAVGPPPRSLSEAIGDEYCVEELVARLPLCSLARLKALT